MKEILNYFLYAVYVSEIIKYIHLNVASSSIIPTYEFSNFLGIPNPTKVELFPNIGMIVITN